MDILLIHNNYSSNSPSGENDVVEAEIEMLRNEGHLVATIVPTSDVLISSLLKRLLAISGSGTHFLMKRKISKLVKEISPEVVHLHNLYPLIGPNIIRYLKKKKIPIVMTVHNYRFTCLKGIHFRKGKICNRCLKKRNPLYGILFRCYRRSFLQSILMQIAQRNLKKNLSKVNRFIVLTSFMKTYLIDLGIEENRVLIRPTYAPSPNNFNQVKDKAVIFVGRLESEKGIELLLKAWKQCDLINSGWVLRVLGQGPLIESLRTQNENISSVQFMGMVSQERVNVEIGRASVLCVTSLMYEGFPRVITQAAANFTPVLLPNIGSLETIGDSNWTIKYDSGLTNLAATLNSIPMRNLKLMGKFAHEWWMENANLNNLPGNLIEIFESVQHTKNN